MLGKQKSPDLRNRGNTGLAPSVPTMIDYGGPIPAAWNLRCEKCGYSLTGLTTRRCPECGENFRPRETWLAGRQKQIEQENSLPAVTWNWAVILAPLIVLMLISLYLLHAIVIIIPVAWILLELFFTYMEFERTSLRIGIVLALFVLIVLSFLL